jgi:hypothetical protein
MNSNDPGDPLLHATTIPDAKPAASAPAERAGARLTPTTLQLVPWGLAAAVGASTVAWFVAESGALTVAPKYVAQQVMGHPFQATTPQSIRAAVAATVVRQSSVYGALLGLALGLAGGLTHRSLRSASRGALLGLVLSAAAVAGVSAVGVPAFYRFRDAFSDEVFPSFLLHGAVWVAAGASAGLAWGVGSAGGHPHAVRCLLGGALGALLGTAAYEVAGAVFFATADTAEPIAATATTRLLAWLFPATLAVAGALTLFRPRLRRSPACDVPAATL